MGLSLSHLVIIAVVVLLLFGTKKLPELGQGLGQAINNFRKALGEGGAIDVTPKIEESAKESKDKPGEPPRGA